MTCCLVPPLSLPLRRALPVGLGLLLLAALVAGDAGAEAGGSLREENPAVGGREGPGAAQPGGPSPECRDGTEDELVALLADFAQEPSVQEVQQWAVGEALAEPSRAAALVGRRAGAALESCAERRAWRRRSLPCAATLRCVLGL